MKKIITLLVLSIVVLSCKDKAVSKVKTENVEQAKERDHQSTLLPVAQFDKTVHNFGVINEGDEIETTFVLTNTGKSDLIISNAKGSCGCTVPTWPKDEPVKPGASVEIGVKFNSRGKKNKQSKTVTLTTNTINGKEVLTIKGEVTPKEKK
ncbi:DUF1573 domain-containing protein [Flavicella sediminum]|uniref:DUF1573 domain-containing protein n=1 Tax=Flavicella sediminum TaxID=2585141 RepID=UPI001124BFCA|nr:DUF1573 domain-containing protein [Flavicella sediminum]